MGIELTRYFPILFFIIPKDIILKRIFLFFCSKKNILLAKFKEFLVIAYKALPIAGFFAAKDEIKYIQPLFSIILLSKHNLEIINGVFRLIFTILLRSSSSKPLRVDGIKCPLNIKILLNLNFNNFLKTFFYLNCKYWWCLLQFG